MDDTEFARRLREIAEDRSHGAAELARLALEVAAASAAGAPASDARELVATLRERAKRLAEARPSMAPLSNLLGGWSFAVRELAELDLDAARREAARLAQDRCERSRRAVDDIAERAAGVIGADRTVITHSLSSTVRALFDVLASRGVRAIVTESRPLLEGHGLAEHLSGAGVPTTLITDAELGHFVRLADAAVVGADSLLADGGVVNKAGTYLLALAAKDRGVPFYVCCESFKRLPEGAGAPALEEMDPSELGAPAWPNVAVANVYFDVTPARLVTAWITEDAIIRTPEEWA